MYTKILSQSDTSTIVTLQEVKANLNIDVMFTADDTLISQMIATAINLAQSYTSRMLTTGQAVIEVECYSPVTLLPWGEVTNIVEVKLDDVVTTDYSFSEITQKLTVDTSTTFSNLKVTYDCGYEANKLPESVKRGVMIMVNDFYVNRESFVLGYNVNDIPMSATNTLNAIRYYGV